MRRSLPHLCDEGACYSTTLKVALSRASAERTTAGVGCAAHAHAAARKITSAAMCATNRMAHEGSDNNRAPYTLMTNATMPHEQAIRSRWSESRALAA